MKKGSKKIKIVEGVSLPATEVTSEKKDVIQYRYKVTLFCKNRIRTLEYTFNDLHVAQADCDSFSFRMKGLIESDSFIIGTRFIMKCKMIDDLDISEVEEIVIPSV